MKMLGNKCFNPTPPCTASGGCGWGSLLHWRMEVGGLRWGGWGVLPPSSPTEVFSQWSCPCPTRHCLPRARGMTEIEMGALRGCGDRDKFERTMGLEIGASRAWGRGQ